jgi:asparagine synthase (glutamine-hydrolysing)
MVDRSVDTLRAGVHPKACDRAQDPEAERLAVDDASGGTACGAPGGDGSMSGGTARTAGRAAARRARAAARDTVALTRVGVRSPRVARQVVAVRRDHLTYLGVPALADLAAAVLGLRRRGVRGSLVECGTALGGSAIVMATAKQPDQELALYDTFGLIPAPTPADGEDVQQRFHAIERGDAQGLQGDLYYGYHEDLLGEVTQSFARHGVPVGPSGVRLVQGMFQDTLHPDGPVALAHLDGDWYESTMTCLQRIVPHLAVGGRLVVDDYAQWSGCRTAVDEFFAGRSDFAWEHRSRLHLVRRA